VKLHVTIDADHYDMLDRYVAAHAGTNRSMVVDEALALWAAQERERATIAQYAPEDLSPQDLAERESWAAIRRQAAARLFHSRP